MSETKTTIAVIGGTGALGSAIAGRLARAGWPVIIGSRSEADAERRAHELSGTVRGMSNKEAAQAADLAILTVPYGAQEPTLRDVASALQGKILVDATVPLVPPRVARVHIPAEGGAALRAQVLLGPDVTVVSAFHNVAAAKLASEGDVACDVLVFGDDKASRETVVHLVTAMGLRGLHAGSLANSIAAEALTSVLIFINKNYSVPGAGIQITGSLTGA